MWTRLVAWLRKTAPEEPPQQRIERLTRGLRSSERNVRLSDENVLARILVDLAASEPKFLISLLAALAREADPERLEIVPRYILLLASGSVSRSGLVQKAAQACLDCWKAQQEKRALADTLLRASQNPGGEEILLRPASDNSEVGTEEYLRPSQQEPGDSSQR